MKFRLYVNRLMLTAVAEAGDGGKRWSRCGMVVVMGRGRDVGSGDEGGGSCGGR